jgi:Tfp pilus assembly protein PilN
MADYTKKTFMGIEFSTSLIRVVKGPQGGGIESLVVVDSFAVKGLSDHAIAQRLKNVFARYSLDKLIVFVPRRSVIVRFLELPSAHESEIRSMVELQLERHLPYAPDEMHYDLTTHPSVKSGYSHVVLAALNKKEVNRILSVCDEADITPDILTLSSCGTFSAYENLPNYQSGYTLIVDADKDETEFILTDGASILMTRSISHTENYLEEKYRVEYIDYVFVELETTLRTARDTHKFETIKSLLLGPSLSSFETLFKERFPDFPHIRSYANLNAMNNHSAPILPNESLFSVLGMLNILQKRVINFLPKTLVRDSLRRESSIDRKIAIILSCLIIMAVTIGIGAEFFSRYAYIYRVENKLREIDPHAQKISRTVKKIKFIDTIRHGQIVPLEIIRELYAVVPETMFLTLLEYNADTGITIRGYAPKLSDVSDFVLLLQKSAFFQNAEIKFAKQKKVDELEGIDFEIYCPYYTVKESL